MDNIRGPFFPDMISELHLNGTRGSLIFAVTSFLAFFGSWSSHRVVHYRSSLFLLNVSLVGLAAGFLGMAASPGFLSLLCACAVLGFAMGAANLAQNFIVVDAAPPALRRRLMSGLHAMYGIAALSAPLIASILRWQSLSWRQGLVAIAVLPAGLAVYGSKAKAVRPRAEARPMLMNRREWALCMLVSMMVSIYLWGEISASTRIVLWLRTDLQFSPDKANLYLALYFLGMLGGRVFFSLTHLQRVGNWGILWASAGLSALLYVAGLKIAPFFLSLAGLTLAPFFPVAMEQTSVLFKEKSAQALGFVIGAGNLSIVIMHVTVGALSDGYGLTNALLAGPVALFTVFVGLSALIFCRAPRREAVSQS